VTARGQENVRQENVRQENIDEDCSIFLSNIFLSDIFLSDIFLSDIFLSAGLIIFSLLSFDPHPVNSRLIKSDPWLLDLQFGFLRKSNDAVFQSARILFLHSHNSFAPSHTGLLFAGFDTG